VIIFSKIGTQFQPTVKQRSDFTGQA